ncbi:MAG: hypothetical protein A2792_03515 [Sphingomonadales bacterium RIFCSPHIGHO2_01_FULL_65_20]|nr:MAG: hypothetical protein A2792_03515 [Sphingomonadales bacterium RIFCSPHIGHO2_01_FULL_65_20]
MTLFDYRERYPNAPGFKAHGTSADAAASMRNSAPRLRRMCLEHIEKAADKGATPDETAAALGLSVLSVRPRFTELARDAAIRPTGETRPNASGRAAKVWVLMRWKGEQ